MHSLRWFRKRAGITQKELAERLGVDQGTISDYETGRITPSGPRLQGLAKALGCSADDIDLAPRLDDIGDVSEDDTTGTTRSVVCRQKAVA